MAGMSTPKQIQIFKPGRHLTRAGSAIEFSASDLAKSAAAYDPAKHEAPIVVGHPRIDAPAYGWISRLKAGDAGLEAEPTQVDPAFAEMVVAGRFKKVSAAFFPPDHPGNPVPGVFYLRHVGFLGAQPPAVKGLRNPEFDEGDEGIVEFADWSDVQNASLWRRLRDFFIAQFGLDKADSVIPDYAVASLETEARTENTDEAAPAQASSFSEPSTTKGDEMSAEDKARLEALEAENKRLKSEARAAQVAQAHADSVSFCEGLVNEGRLQPGKRDLAIALMDHLASQEAPVEFGEGDAKQPMIDAFKGFLSAQPKGIEFAERSADKEGAVAAVEFSAPDGFDVDAAGLERLARVQAYATQNKVSLDQALATVR